MQHFNTNRTDQHAVRRAKSADSGPDRLRTLIRLADKDLERVLALPDPPKVLADALAAYADARRIADDAAGERDRAMRAEEAERRTAVTRIMKALRTGKKPQLPAGATDHALAASLTTAAAEELLLDAWADVADALREVALQWRPSLIEQAKALHKRYADAARKAASAHAAAVERYASVGVLDSEMRARFADIREACDSETRDGRNWYALTHGGKVPLRRIPIRNVQDRGKPVTFPAADVLAGAVQAAEADDAFPVSKWSLPGEPGHNEQVDPPGTPRVEPPPDRAPEVNPGSHDPMSYYVTADGAHELDPYFHRAKR